VAELASSFVLADLGIAHRPRAEHAAYIAFWVKALKDDPRAIFTAASKAQQAADWMHAQQPVATPPSRTETSSMASACTR
jgi:antirestriction protein ArdC